MPSEEIFRIVADDIVHGLRDKFGPRGDQSVIINPDLDDGDESVQEGGLTAVPWIYRSVHDGDFQGMFRTDTELEIHGVTFIDNRGDEQLLYRYVDWMGVVNQLGLEVSWRVPVNEEQYRNVRNEIEHEDES